MKNIDEALAEISTFREDACTGKLTETQCKERFASFQERYGNDLIVPVQLDSIRNEPASKEKLRKLQSILERGGVAEETFVEMARTGRALRDRKRVCIAAAIAAFIASVTAIIVIISWLKK